jgi:4-hydroxythreonine-4-phosphate dehydrogenase
MPSRPSRLGITMGDAAGIGPEVVVRALAGRRVPRSARMVLYGSPEVFRSAVRRAHVALKLKAVANAHEAAQLDDAIGCIDPTHLRTRRAGTGRVSAAPARAAMACVSAAVRDALAGELDGIVTAPINKDGLRRAGIPYAGHTEFLAAEAGAPHVAMLFVGGGLRVVLVTIHEPLERAVRLITTVRVRTTIGLLHDALKGAFGIEAPRIGVCGLNPHAGERGLLGTRDAEQIAPAVRQLRSRGLDVTGPLPADTLFARHRTGEFDAVAAMYHDQGLIPVKLLAFDSAVNVTLGLPFVRTSPAHGTAYDIAPRFVARPGSMEAALRLAARLARQRRRRSC